MSGEREGQKRREGEGRKSKKRGRQGDVEGREGGGGEREREREREREGEREICLLFVIFACGACGGIIIVWGFLLIYHSFLRSTER